MEEFRALRQRLAAGDEASAAPLAYLPPFLEVIRSVDTSGPITGAALAALDNLLRGGLVRPGGVEAPAAIHAIVGAVTHCRFEATDPDSDEAVLARILHVLLQCLKCPAGRLLSDDAVCSAVQTCYRIGHQTGKKGGLLRQTSRHILHEAVRELFTRLPAILERGGGGEGGRGVAGVEGGAGEAAAGEAGPSAGGRLEGMEGEATSQSHQAAAAAVGPPAGPYGEGCLKDILHFLASLISDPEEEPDIEGEDLATLGLSLTRVALEASGEHLARCPTLVEVVQGGLTFSLLDAAASQNLLVLSLACGIASHLYAHLKSFLRFQLEAFVSCVLMRVAEGRDSSYEQQEVVLEALVDLCRQPGFMVDMYANFDCALDCPNVFEGLASLLSKNSFPVNSPLATVHLLSLEGLLAIVNNIQTRCELDAHSTQGEMNGAGAEEGRSGASGQAPAGATAGAGVGGADGAGAGGLWDPPTVADPVAWARAMQLKKTLKRRVAIGVDHFNRDHKKGFEFLQGAGVLSDPLSGPEVARLFRHCIGLNKNVIGELLGSPKDFDVEVLKAFVVLFDFKGLTLDMALRMYLESFFLPGEAQKIGRILEVFAEKYHRENPGVMANPDAVYILSYSLLMLHTDQHNSQVKKKMTLEEFIRNNRNINDGADLPKEVLSELYDNIRRHEIRIKDDGGHHFDLSAAQRAEIMQRSAGPGGALRSCAGPGGGPLPLFDRDMFAMIWGPTIAAISVVFDHAEEEAVVQRALGGFLVVARVAASYKMEDVVDNLVISLCKFTTLLNSSLAPAQVAVAEDTKALLAVVTVFCLANKHGDWIRSGWRNVVDCLVRLNRLGLLPEGTTVPEEMRDMHVVRSRSASQARGARSGSLLSSVSNQLSSFMSLEGEAKEAKPSEEEEAARARIKDYIEACRIDEIVADSKFLQNESLEQLAKSVVWAAGEVHSGLTLGPDEEDTHLLCLDLLLGITFRNRDRIMLLWPIVQGHLSAIITSTGTAVTPLVERAVFGLLRLCQRLVPYKSEIAGELLEALQLVLKLDAKVADQLAEPMMTEVLHFVKGCGGCIRNDQAWQTVCSLLKLASLHPEASASGFEALEHALTRCPEAVSRGNFRAFLETVGSFAGGRTGEQAQAERATALMAVFYTRLAGWAAGGAEAAGAGPGSGAGEGDGSPTDLWWDLLSALLQFRGDPREGVREQARRALQEFIQGAEALGLPPDGWLKLLDAVGVQHLGDCAARFREAHKRRQPGLDMLEAGTASLVGTVAQTFLAHSERFTGQAAFPELWMRFMGVMEQLCQLEGCNDLAVTGGEAVKKIVLRLAEAGVLQPEWRSGEGVNVWNVTWQKCHAISPNISPSLLGG